MTTRGIYMLLGKTNAPSTHARVGFIQKSKMFPCFLLGVFMKYHRLCRHFANKLSGIMYARRGMTQAMPLRQYKSNVLSLKPMSEKRTETLLNLQIIVVPFWEKRVMSASLLQDFHVKYEMGRYTLFSCCRKLRD